MNDLLEKVINLGKGESLKIGKHTLQRSSYIEDGEKWEGFSVDGDENVSLGWVIANLEKLVDENEE